jgi:signal transduction histidine kinase/streptogramin lyase
MHLPVKNIVLSLLFLTFWSCTAGQENYRVVNWNMEQGMSNGFIRCMIRDQYGFLWLGSQVGLNRFDGYSFKIFLPDENDSRSLLNKNIRGLIEDSLHNIWIGTDEGLSRYDIQADTFTNFLPQVDTPGSNNSMIPFWASKDELFCLEELAKITVFNIHSFSKIKTVLLSHKVDDNARNQDMVYEERSDAVWRLPDNQEKTGGGLYRLSLSTGKEEHFDWPCFKKIDHHFHWSEGMCYDKLRNSIWINNNEGLMQFSLSDKRFHYADAVQERHNPAPGINVDSKDRVWVGTGSKGIFIYDPATRSAITPFPYDSALQMNINDMNLKIYCDRESITWVVYWTQKGLGVNQLIPYSPADKRYDFEEIKPKFIGKSMLRFPEMAEDGRLYFNSGYKITIMDPRTGSERVLGIKDLKGIDEKKNFVFLAIDKKGRRAWMVEDATFDLKQLDIQTQQCRPVIIKNIFGQVIDHVELKEDYAAYFIRKFRDNPVFWGLKPDKREGIFMFDPDSAIAREIVDLQNDRATKIIIDHDHIIIKTKNKIKTNLICTYVNGRFLRSKLPLDSMSWTTATADQADSSWWIANDRKLIHFANHFKKKTIFPVNGVVPQGSDIYGIVQDNHGDIWFNTNHYLAKLSPSTGNIINLSVKDGFKPQEYLFTSFPAMTRNGDIYVHGYQGRDIVDPGKLREIYPPSYVYFKALEINQQSYPISTGINNLHELKLRYFQNKVDIETGIIDFYSKGESRLRYRLDGRDSNWQYGSYYNRIRYEGLPAGNYRLIIQASNVINEFNGPAKTLTIRISPAFWNTVWFRVAAVFPLIGLIYWLVQFRSRRLKEKNAQLEEKVIQRTRELKHSLEELSETQSQLIQREKMASLGELTAGIAHEIQNPLNFVNNFSEINAELIDEMNEDIKSGNLEEASEIAVNVKENNIKISHHGKRADSIVKGMLQHSRSSTGQKEPTNINALADEYMRLSYHGLRAKDKSFNATMKTDFDKNAENINIVTQDVGRVFLNLFNNSFYAVNEKQKMQPQGYEPTIWVTSRQTGNQIEIRIKDNGMGIPQKLLDKIFQPFFTTKPTGEGTGLGLSLSYEIITKGHGGVLKVESKEGEYVEFIIVLPGGK